MIVKKKIRIFILCWQQSFHGEVNEYLGKKIGCEGTSEREYERGDCNEYIYKKIDF